MSRKSDQIYEINIKIIFTKKFTVFEKNISDQQKKMSC